MDNNTLQRLAVLMLIALGLVGCDKGDNAENNDKVAIEFSAQIGSPDEEEVLQSRASGETWDANDHIGIYMVDNGTTTIAMEGENKKFITENGDGKFAATTGEEIYYPVNGTDKFDFIAYYPYKHSGNGTDEIDNFIYPIDLSDQSEPKDIDLLYAESYSIRTSGYDKYTPEVDLVFYHQLSKFTIETVAGAGLTENYLKGMTVVLKSMNTKAQFDLKTATISGESMAGDIIFNPTTDGEQYEAIVLPASTTTEGEWIVEFGVNGNTYIWKVPAVTLEQGKENIWKISVQKTPVLVSSRIEGWGTGVTGTGTAE